MKRHLLLIIAVASVGILQMGCAPLAAGVAGAAIGHEAAERRDEDDDDRD
jgi:hypothetical protein